MRRLLPRSPQGRAVFAIVTLVAVLNAVAVAGDALFPSPEGPRSSAFATAPEGAAAWAELARRSGIEVRMLRSRPADDTLPAGGTVVMLDPQDVTGGQVRALRRFAERDGTVVAGGREPEAWLHELVDDPPRWEDEAPRNASAQAGDAERVHTAGEGRWASTTRGRELVSGPTVVERDAGRGRIVLVADPSPLQNRLLDQADNAALALALPGEGPLTFVESVHGYGTATGLAALPARFKWALILLALSGLALIAARWPRLGPPAERERPLFPPRRAYVDALAATLARSRDRTAAVEAVRSAARDRLARGTALARDADAEAWAAAARAAGLTDEEARALRDDGDDDGIAAGRALARLQRREARWTA
jgi:Domain of unknown function (DUF4350)